MTKLHFQKIGLGLALGCLLSLSAVAQTFVYEKSIALTTPAPYACAVDANGGLYYVTFDAANSALHYIADPINADSTIVTTAVSPTTAFPAGRGLQGVSVDSAGNVFVSGDNGQNESVIRKFGPAPTFTPDGTFAPTPDTRLLGCSHYDDDYVMAVTFNSIRFYNTTDGTVLGGLFVDSASNYQRDIVRNPANNDLYVARNGNSVVGSVILWTGGSAPSNLNLYVRDNLNYITNLAGTDAFGGGSQGIGFYPARNYIFVMNNTGAFTPSDSLGQLDVYEVASATPGASASLKTSIDAATDTGTQIGDELDAVMFDYDGVELLFITDTGNDRILVYKFNEAPSSVTTWDLY